MADTFKTAALFVSDLPAMPAGESVRYHYGDMADMPLLPRAPESAWENSAWGRDDSFRGGTVANAITLARAGWQDGAEQARALRAGVQAAMPVRRRLARYDVAGPVPSIPRALAGNPLCMRRMVRKETSQRPVITLVCDICVSAAFPAGEMLKHAAAVAACVDVLEDGGFRCEVLVVARVTENNFASEIAVRLKAPEAPMNLATLAYGLGHPSFFRRLMFGVWQGDQDCKPLGQGLGMVHRLEAAPELGTFTVAAASAAGSYASAPARFRAILTRLATQGCPGIPTEALAA